jgi:hypothetical protein
MIGNAYYSTVVTPAIGRGPLALADGRVQAILKRTVIERRPQLIHFFLFSTFPIELSLDPCIRRGFWIPAYRGDDGG